jgi:hypothetical protein
VPKLAQSKSSNYLLQQKLAQLKLPAQMLEILYPFKKQPKSERIVLPPLTTRPR